MGGAQSCQSADNVSSPETAVSTLPILYTLSFKCYTIPVDKTHTIEERIFYAERWCSNAIFWKAIVENAVNEVIYMGLYPNSYYPKMRINGLKIHTWIDGDVISGRVSWFCGDINLELLNDIVVVTGDADIYSKGVHLVEPGSTTSLLPTKIIKGSM